MQERSPYPASQQGICLSCGLLSKLNVDPEQWPDPGVWQITQFDRREGKAFLHIPSATAGQRQTLPFCLAHAANLWGEVESAIVLSSIELMSAPQIDETKRTAAKQVFEKPDRNCPEWYPYTEGLGPNGHLAEYRMRQLEQRREEFEQRME